MSHVPSPHRTDDRSRATTPERSRPDASSSQTPRGRGTAPTAAAQANPYGGRAKARHASNGRPGSNGHATTNGRHATNGRISTNGRHATNGRASTNGRARIDGQRRSAGNGDGHGGNGDGNTALHNARVHVRPSQAIVRLKDTSAAWDPTTPHRTAQTPYLEDVFTVDAVAAGIEPRKYKSYQMHNFRDIPQVEAHLTQEQVFDIEVVGHVFPFKTNNYVVDELIDWDDVPNDPMFVLTFPQRGMLIPEHYDQMAAALKSGDRERIKATAHEIRLQLNPHPAGQMEHNVPEVDGERLPGMQHKYRETVLFFPSQGQTCHAYCSFCFRWPQFVEDDLRFAMKEVELLIDYLEDNPKVTDVLFTGGDPMVMSPRIIANYLDALVRAKNDGRAANLRTIRIGSKSLTYWPYKFVTDKGADEVLDVFRRVTDAGIHLAFMAHFNHPVELETPAVKQAVRNIRATGAVIRSQTPLLAHINDDADLWAAKWQAEVDLGVIPYYMFVARDTGAQHYFGVPLMRAWEIYRKAYQQVSGLARTVRGPSMSADPGKVEMLGPMTIGDEKVMAFRFLQGRNPDWVDQVFLAKHDEDAVWLNDLQPALGQDRWFWSDDFARIYETEGATGAMFQDGPTAKA